MKVTKLIMVIFFVVLIMTVGLAGANEEQPLSNDDIIKLTKLAIEEQVIITKIKTANAVNFDTSTNDLVKLKEAGVSGPVIKALLERSASSVVNGTAAIKGSGTSIIVLVTKEGDFEIKPTRSFGKVKTVSAPFRGFWGYLDFPADATATRVKDRFPSLLLSANDDPHKAIWFVKLSPWPNGVLALDLKSSSISREFFSNEPDDGCTISYTTAEEKPGLWRITPKRELEPGDYGLFRWAAYNDVYSSTGLLVGFGID